jgi:8-oxo-dGTP diphosphatase
MLADNIQLRFKMKHLEVVGGILIFKGKILCMQRNIGKYEYLNFKYEFPGGKVEPGENRPQALMRELKEELDIDLHVSDSDYFGEVSYKYPDFEITMYCYLCHLTSDHFRQKEHINYKWMTQNGLHKLDWAPADYPIVKKLEKVNCIE